MPEEESIKAFKMIVMACKPIFHITSENLGCYLKNYA